MSSGEEYEEIYDDEREESGEEYNNANRITLDLKFDKNGQKVTSFFDGLVNKFLRQYLWDRFDENTNEYVNDYKVDTRALGGFYDDHKIPIIMRKKSDWHSSRTIVDERKHKAVVEMRIWSNDIKRLDFKGTISEYLNHKKLRSEMITKLDAILNTTHARGTGFFGSNDGYFGRYTRKGGNSQRKRSRKNITRRKK